MRDGISEARRGAGPTATEKKGWERDGEREIGQRWREDGEEKERDKEKCWRGGRNHYIWSS